LETATPERAPETTAEPVLVPQDGPPAEAAAEPAPAPIQLQPVVCIPPGGIALEEIERQALLEALRMSNWVQKDAAELLSISPRVMNYKIMTHGLDDQVKRGRKTAAGAWHPSS
jgi:transcriptional regulator with GAF, ATPase, and Fis domain